MVKKRFYCIKCGSDTHVRRQILKKFEICLDCYLNILESMIRNDLKSNKSLIDNIRGMIK